MASKIVTEVRAAAIEPAANSSRLKERRGVAKTTR
jgi:hypothetical protein